MEYFISLLFPSDAAIRDKYNINVLILDSDSKMVKTTMVDQEFAVSVLRIKVQMLHPFRDPGQLHDRSGNAVGQSDHQQDTHKARLTRCARNFSPMCRTS